GDGSGRTGQAPSGPFEQQAAPHLSGCFLDERAEDAVEVRAAPVGEPGQLASAVFQVERCCYCLSEPFCITGIHDWKFNMGFAGMLDLESQKRSAGTWSWRRRHRAYAGWSFDLGACLAS